MPQLSALIVALFTTVLVPWGLAPAGNPATAPQTPGTQASFPKPTNLKVLPRNTTGAEIDKLMRQYNGDLGVKCEFCHDGNAADPTKTDYASDANPTKDVARYMMSMTADINEKYIDPMPDRQYAEPVTCGTCHRGAKHPSVFVPTPK
jgi:Photosynthetic reaction centre cytochrome C subunit